MSNDFYVLVAARFAQVLLGLASIRVATTLLSVEQYGVLSLLVSFNGFFGLFLINPVGQHIQRHTHQWVAEGSVFPMLRRFNRYVVVVSFLAIILVVVWSSARNESTRMAWLTALVVGWIVYATTRNGTFVSMLNMIGLRWASASLTVLTTFVSLVSSIILARQISSGVLWLTGQALGLSIGAVMAQRVLQRKVRPMVHITSNSTFISWDSIRSFCFPLAIATGFMFALISGYRFVVEWGWGVRALGFMAIGFAVSSQMWSVCETLLMQFLFPHFYRAISSNDRIEQQRAYSNLINAIIPIYLLLLAVTLACGGWAVAVLTNAKFHDAYEFALYGAGIEWFRAMASLLSQAAQVTKRTAYVIMPYAMAGTVAIGGIFIASWMQTPITMVPIVLVAAGLVLLLTMGFQMNRIMFVDIKWCELLTMGLFSCIIFCISMIIGLKSKSFNGSIVSLIIIGLIASIAMYIYSKQNDSYRALLAVPLVTVPLKLCDIVANDVHVI